MRRNTFFAVTLLMSAACAACARPDDQKTGSVDQTEMAKAQRQVEPDVGAYLDSGNVAFRAKDFTNASRLYREAARRDKKTASGWFGVYMAETALKNPAGADSALQKVQAMKPGASLVHPQSGAAPVSPHPLPSPHPIPPQHP